MIRLDGRNGKGRFVAAEFKLKVVRRMPADLPPDPGPRRLALSR